MSDVATSQAVEPLATSSGPTKRPSRPVAPTIRRLAGMAIMIGAWQVYASWSDNRLVPSLGAIWDSLYGLADSGDLWFHARLTLFRGFVGLALAVVFGVAVGLVMARSRWVNAALEPILSGLYSIPKISLYPVMIAIFGLGGTAKVWQVAIECAFPIAFNTYAGARSVDKTFLQLARNTGASGFRVIKDIIVPSTLPSALTGLRIATPIMLIVITVTELIGESRGLGFLIGNAQANFRPAEAMAVVVVLGIIGFTLDRINVFLGKRLVFWEKGVQL